MRQLTKHWRPMSRLRDWLLPVWAQPDHPLLHYEMPRFRANGGRGRLPVQLASLSFLLGGAAALYALTILHPTRGSNLTSLIWQSLYYPALILQLFTLILALTLGAAAVGGERRRKTWDKLRATEFGAGLALRARYAGILYRLRAPIATILLARVVLAAGMLYDLTAFDGLYARMLATQAKPPLPEWRLDLLLIALAAAVNLLLPLAQIAVIAALGILISVAFRERIYAISRLDSVLRERILSRRCFSSPFNWRWLGAGAYAIAGTLLNDAPPATDLSYALVLAHNAFADCGLLLAQLGSLGEIWRRVDYGASLSLALMLWLFVLGLAADGVIWLAGRLSESRG